MNIRFNKQKGVSYPKWQVFLYEKIIFGCIVLLLMTSCESFVDVDPPQSDLTGEVVFDDVATAEAALANIYAKLRDEALTTGGSDGITFLLGLYADELNPAGFQSESSLTFHNNALIPTNGDVNSFWSGVYNLIFETNSIIERVNSSVRLNSDEKNQLLGLALFLRAFLHFYLVNLYGDIPYITTTDFRVNTEVSRLPQQEVYTLIISDLEEARSLLPEEYVTGERIFANKSVASALLARTFLFTENWESAANESASIIEDTGLFTLQNDLGLVFLKESTSTIWQLKSIAGSNTAEGVSFVTNEAPPPVSLGNTLLNAFEPGDLRRDLWTADVSDETTVFSFPFKYKEQAPTGNSLEYSILFRLAEQYLIRAEARAQLGDIAGAQADLNVIRNRAGLGNTTAATTNDVLEAILQERQVELFTEFGHRFFDLKRTGRADAVLGPVKPGWNATDVLLPIPESELIVNPNLAPQNPGY